MHEVERQNQYVESVDASAWLPMQWLAVRKYGIVVDASLSASSVPVQRNDEPPEMKVIRATALICALHAPIWQVASV